MRDHDTFSEQDHSWMQRALELAHRAASKQEVPVGAVLVQGDRVIGEGHNSPIAACDPTAHAEILALRMGARTLQNYRLTNTTLYVTLEPCLMCIGALVHARVKCLIVGAPDTKAGASTHLNLSLLNHRIEYKTGLMKQACGAVLSDFFKAKRQNN